MSARRVLLVDDECFLRAAIAESLAMEGHEVEQASTAQEAFLAFADRPFDVVVTDLCLPGEGGIELLGRLRALDPRFTAIVTTGFGTFDQAVAAIGLRVAAFLTKPFSVRELSRAIAEGAGEQAAGAPRGFRARADAAGAAGLLAKLGGYLTSRGVDPAVAARALALSGEALDNAVQHAYPNETGTIEVEPREDEGTLEVCVLDRGCGFDRAEALTRSLTVGRTEGGLVRFHREADAVRLQSRPGEGTSVHLSFRHAFESQSQRSTARCDDALAVALLWS